MFLQWFLYIRPKLLKLSRKNFSEISDTKGGGNKFFKFGMGEKKGGNQNFYKIFNLWGDQSLTHYGHYRGIFVISWWNKPSSRDPMEQTIICTKDTCHYSDQMGAFLQFFISDRPILKVLWFVAYTVFSFVEKSTLSIRLEGVFWFIVTLIIYLYLVRGYECLDKYRYLSFYKCFIVTKYLWNCTLLSWIAWTSFYKRYYFIAMYLFHTAVIIVTRTGKWKVNF